MVMLARRDNPKGAGTGAVETKAGDGANPNGKDDTGKLQEPQLAVPSLPKGGGAIRGMGEKFDVNPSKGTASLTVPILTSPGRDGFGPQLAISYDSANGNGIFGFGWALAMDSITRKTSKGLPRYADWEESDVFLISGAEDLVPLLQADGSRNEDKSSAPGYVLQPYIARIGALTSRIERWTNLSNPLDVHWRVYSGDNTINIYGRTENSRIYNPERPEQIFSWLLSDRRDWKGNALALAYKAENGQGVDMNQPHEQSRGEPDDKKRTANRYIKSIRYGNRVPFVDNQGQRIVFPTQSFIDGAGWMFQVLFDYGEHNGLSPTPTETSQWPLRDDAFSNFRSGFDVRTARLCRRVLMFHHFPEIADVGQDCLVSSTDLIYHQPPTIETARTYTMLDAVEQSGYRRDQSQPGGYVKRSLPQVEMTYSKPVVDDNLRPVSPEMLHNAPAGLSSSNVRWIDLYGEGVSGILTQTEGAWYYKRNLSPSQGTSGTPKSPEIMPVFGDLETIPSFPHKDKGDQILFADLLGDGILSVMNEDGSFQSSLYGDAKAWMPFHPFQNTLNSDLQNPDLRLLDLTGDGLMDAFLTKDALWYQSLGVTGFCPPQILEPVTPDSYSVTHIFKNDILGTVHFADFTGDGLVDIAGISNGEIWFLPNIGYGQFGQRIVMGNAPVFDRDDNFDPQRILLADVDGSGTTDIIYVGKGGARVYLNQSGNSWGTGQLLTSTTEASGGLDFQAIDILGNGTTCLVVSDPLPTRSYGMQYVNLNGTLKPHLLLQVDNNLGASTVVTYSTSTKFLQLDEANGMPWIGKMAFPVHVVDSRTVYDRIGRNVYSSRYAYHHGHFDGQEREFRGFGMTEQWDTDELSANFVLDGQPANQSAAYALPPVHTKTWFHLGIVSDANTVSRIYASEYFNDSDGWLLPDTILPLNAIPAEEFDAFRSLKGSVLRKEIYMDDAPPNASEDIVKRAQLPFSVVESNFTLTKIQPKSNDLPAVFMVTPRETLSHEYDRNLDNPRIGHNLTLECNQYGQTLREITIAYGRRSPDTSLPTQWDQNMQTKSHMLYSLNEVTGIIDNSSEYPNTFRLPGVYQQRQYEVTGVFSDPQGLFSFDQFASNNFAAIESATEIAHDAVPDPVIPNKRLLSLIRTLFREDDLSGLLPLQQMQSRGIIGQNYALALTDSLIKTAYTKSNTPLMSNPDALLTSVSGDGGGYMSSASLKASNLFPNDDLYDGYWISSALSFYSASNNVADELAFARAHFFKPCRTRNAFGAETLITFDQFDLMVMETRDSVGNVITVGERNAMGQLTKNGNDYRVLQPNLITDCNDNRTAVLYDALKAVAGTATMGKIGEQVGDTLDGFEPDLEESSIIQYMQQPTVDAKSVLQDATTRIIYDLFAYVRAKNSANPQPVATASITRTRHTYDADASSAEFHNVLSYGDGFARSIQSKIQVKPGPTVMRDAQGNIVMRPDGQPQLTSISTDPRWVASGWSVFNNKGLTVAEYEPFFTSLTTFEFDTRVGVSVITFYDAIGRTVAVLNPNGSYTKTRFSPWLSENWDCNDTVALDPRTDSDVSQYMSPFLSVDPNFQTWLEQHMNLPPNDPGRRAAEQTLAHASTPVISYFDSLGRAFIRVGHNKVSCPGHDLDGQDWKQYTRMELDIQGHGLASRDANTENSDALGRIIETYQYDMLGRAMVHKSMDAGTRISLTNALNNELCVWDDRGHRVNTTYDRACRPLFASVQGDQNAPNGSSSTVVFNYNIYGEHHPRGKQLNLRGTMYLSADQAGVIINEQKDFKNNLLNGSRRFCTEYKTTVDWSALKTVIAPDMDGLELFDEAKLRRVLDTILATESFTDSATFDALDRPLTCTSPNSDGKPTTARYTYAIDSLDKIEANIRSQRDSGNSSVWTAFIKSLDFDARGLQTRTEYGNGVSSSSEFSVMRELTRHLSVRSSAGGRTDVLQDLNYVYDPMQHQTTIMDNAQQTLYFNGQVVSPNSDYAYDALYQLIRANGREHLGQDGGSPLQYPNVDGFRRGPQPGDANAMARYTEDYVQDWAGNMLKLKHAVGDPAATGHTWTRSFVHEETSLLEPSKHGNKLTSTSTSTNTELMAYDEHGNVTRMPNLGGSANTTNVTWDFLDRMASLDLGGGGKAYYVYDRGGKRVRKIIERSPGLTQERLYLGATAEIYREHRSGEVTLERESQHIIDQNGRVAIIETRTIDLRGTDRAPPQVQRWQLSNHLESVAVELDQNAQVLTYEEYSPYGSTTWAAEAPSLELPRRYRFTGKERDEESGLNYHNARYYAPWIARWISCDPEGAGDGPNLYEYCSSNPILMIDPSGTEDKITPLAQWVAENQALVPDFVKNIVYGRDAEMYAVELESAASPGLAIAKEVVIGVRDKLGFFHILARLDYIKEGTIVEVKWFGLHAEDVIDAGKLVESSGLHLRILDKLRSAESTFKAFAEYSKGTWTNPRMAALGNTAPGDVKMVLKLVAEGEPQTLVKLQQFANEVRAIHQSEVAIEVIKGSGRSFEQAMSAIGKAGNFVKPMTLKALAGLNKYAVPLKVAGGALAIVGGAVAGYQLATATNTKDKVFAGLSLLSNGMTLVGLIPGFQVVGLAGLALSAGVVAAQYVMDDKGKEPSTPAKEGPPAPAQSAPSSSPSPVSPAPASSQRISNASSQISNPALGSLGLITSPPGADKGVINLSPSVEAGFQPATNSIGLTIHW